MYDAVVVGSGAGGGMAGYVLANAGLKVLMLEAGPFFDPAKDALQLRWPWESPRRGAGTTRPFGDFDAAYGGWELDGEPYTKKPGLNSTGSGHACLAAGRIIGDGSRCAWARMISNPKTA